MIDLEKMKLPKENELKYSIAHLIINENNGMILGAFRNRNDAEKYISGASDHIQIRTLRIIE